MCVGRCLGRNRANLGLPTDKLGRTIEGEVVDCRAHSQFEVVEGAQAGYRSTCPSRPTSSQGKARVRHGIGRQQIARNAVYRSFACNKFVPHLDRFLLFGTTAGSDYFSMER
jgi:hypothetical protein